MAFGASNTTVVTGTLPNFIVPDIQLLHVAREWVGVRHHNVADLSGSTIAGFSENNVIPDGNSSYRLCIIMENGVTPPASNSDYYFFGFNVLDGTRLDVSPRVSGFQDATQSFPVSITAFPTGATTISLASQVTEDGTQASGINAMLRASNANPTAMSATADAVRALATMIGAMVVKPHALQEASWNSSLALTTTTAAAIQTAGGAGLRRHITNVQAINTGASAVDLIILDGVTERWRLTLPVNVPVDFNFDMGLLVTVNTALNANLSAAGTVRANFQGYTAP